MRPSLRLAALAALSLLAVPTLRAQSAGGSAILTTWTEDDTPPARGNDLGRIARDAEGRMIVAETWEMPYDPYYQTPGGTQTGTRLHRWDGRRWSHLDVRVPNVYFAPTVVYDAARVYALALAENDTLVAATSQGLIKWTGTGWKSMYIAYEQAVAQGSPVTTPSGAITRVVYSAAERRLYVSGSGFKVERPAEGTLMKILSQQNGVGYLDLATRRWVGIGGQAIADIADIALGADGRLYAAGAFTKIGGQGIEAYVPYYPNYPYVVPVAARHVARFTGSGTAWEAAGAGPGDPSWLGSPLALRLAPGGALHAFGNYTASGVRQGVDYRFDGAAWTEVDDAAPAPGGLSFAQTGIEFAPDGTLYLSSATRCATQSSGGDCARRWTGSAWEDVGGKLLAHDVVYNIGYGGGPQRYGGMSGLAFEGGGRLCTFGTFYLSNPSISRSTTSLACRPSAASGDWTLQISGLVGTVSALARTTDGTLYAGGNVQQAALAPVQNLMVQVGGAWQAVPGAPNGPVYALASDGAGGLYVGGAFTRIGGSTSDNARNLARYTPGAGGGTWASVGGGVGGAVRALVAAPGGGVIAGGTFASVYATYPGTARAHQSVARWTGSAWETGYSLAGTTNIVHTLVYGPDGALYVAGGSMAYGMYPSGSLMYLNGVGRWTPGAGSSGGAWAPLAAGMSSFSLTATWPLVRSLAFGPGGQLCAGGTFYNDPGVYDGGPRSARVDNLACFNGSQWLAPAAPFPGMAAEAGGASAQGTSGAQAAMPEVNALAGDGAALYVGGTSVLARVDGSAWRTLVAPGAPAPGVAALLLTPSGLTSAGAGLPVEIPSGSLPVELTAFTARSDGPGRVRLAWTTASETNNAGFSIEQAGGDGRWTERATVAGRGTTSEAHAYAHTLDGLAPGRTRLRLVQRDLDGTAHAGPTVEVTVAGGGALAVTAWPVPAQTTLHVRLGLAAPAAATARLYDALGREVLRAEVPDGAAPTFEMPVSGLAAGVYVLRVAAGREVATVRVVVAR